MGRYPAHDVLHHGGVHARAERRQHLDDGQRAAGGGEHLRRLKSRHAGADDGDRAARRDAPQQHILRRADVFPVDPRQRRDQRLRAAGDEDAAGGDRGDAFHCRAPAKARLYPRGLREPRERFCAARDFFFSIALVRRVERAAESRSLLKYHGRKAALFQGKRRFDAGGAAADDRNGAPRAVFHGMGELTLPASQRVDGAFDAAAFDDLAEAGETADAPSDLVLPAGKRLAAPARIGEVAAPDADEVAYAALQQAFRRPRLLDVADGDDRYRDGLFHRLRHIALPALFVGAGFDAAAAVAADVDRGGPGLFEGGGDLCRLFQVYAARQRLLRVDAHGDGEGDAAAFSYRRDDLADEAHPVFKAAAVAVAAEIHRRREKFVDKVAVGRVKLYAVGPRHLRIEGGVREFSRQSAALLR